MTIFIEIQSAMLLAQMQGTIFMYYWLGPYSIHVSAVIAAWDNRNSIG